MKRQINFKKDHNPEILLERLEKIIIKVEPDRVESEAFETIELEWLFLSILDYDDSISKDSMTNILSKTINKIANDKNYSRKHFIEVLNKCANEYYAKVEKTYYMYAALSIKNLPFRKINIGSSQIIIHGKQFPKEFRAERKTFFKLLDTKLENKDFTKVSVIIKSRNTKDAFQQCYENLAILRAFLNLLLNPKFQFRFQDRRLDPINKIRTSEIFSLHNEEDRFKVSPPYWYIPDYKEAKVLEIKDENRKVLAKNIKWLTKKYNNCNIKHQEALKKALNLYVGAFDEKNKYVCFLKAWTALEILTNTDQNKILIKRVNAMYKEDIKPFQKQILESLRQYRNENVHKGENDLEPLNACFYVQGFIFKLIFKFNLKYSGFFKNIEEANLFLDNYTPNLIELKSRKKILDRAIQLKEKNTER